eukprot:6171912-Pleurochrysis_carterae.AAC.2
MWNDVFHRRRRVASVPELTSPVDAQNASDAQHGQEAAVPHAAIEEIAMHSFDLSILLPCRSQWPVDGTAGAKGHALAWPDGMLEPLHGKRSVYAFKGSG